MSRGPSEHGRIVLNLQIRQGCGLAGFVFCRRGAPLLRQAKRLLRAERAAAPVLPIVPGWETAAGHLSAFLCLKCNKNVPVRNKCAIQKLRKSFIFSCNFAILGPVCPSISRNFRTGFFSCNYPLEFFGKRI